MMETVINNTYTLCDLNQLSMEWDYLIDQRRLEILQISADASLTRR